MKDEAQQAPGQGRGFSKTRPIWRFSAYRLLRERTCARFASQVVPAVVGGFKILFPTMEITAGLYISVRSQHIPGRPLHLLLYEPERRGLVLDLGMAVLEALHTADVTHDPFGCFGRFYRPYLSVCTLLQEQCSRSPLLSQAERRELRRLAWGYVFAAEQRQVLVHGDLQPAHLIVDPEASTVGIIDLETLHIGKPAANLGQLLIGYHYADATLGQDLCRRYRERHLELFDDQFDDDLRAVVALRTYRHVRIARRHGYRELEHKARGLLTAALSGACFAEAYPCGGDGC